MVQVKQNHKAEVPELQHAKVTDALAVSESLHKKGHLKQILEDTNR